MSMMKMAHPWARSPAGSKRREVMSLGGAGLIFFAGLSGESASLVQSAQHLVGNLIQLVLVWLGLVSPVTSVQARPQAAVPAPVHFIKRHTPPVVIKADSDSMRLGTYQHRRHYTYLFEGKTTFHNSPCANASVLVRLISGDQTIAKGTVTDANGSYVL